MKSEITSILGTNVVKFVKEHIQFIDNFISEKVK